MTAWSSDIALCTNGAAKLSESQKTQLRRNGIRIIEHRIDRLIGSLGKLQEIIFHGGDRLKRSALFFDMPCNGQSRLAESLGCEFTRDGGIKCGQHEATSVPGVFVAGNIIKDVQLAIVAAAEGTRAAFGINRALTREDFDRRAMRSRRIHHPSLEDKEMRRRRRKNA
jgi:thioredoxin reductase